jgi:malate dehydrogenase (quinone)
LSDADRLAALKEYFPDAKQADWRLWQAGQRVQIIKRDADKGGILKLGTEIVASQDGTIAALLGASPGASTAAPIMLDLMAKVFKDKLATPAWQEKVRQIVPSYGTHLNDNPVRAYEELSSTAATLQLTPPPRIDLIATPAPQPAVAPESKTNSVNTKKQPADIAL